MSRMVQVRLTGAGGQGLITAGVILGEAAVLQGMYVVQTQSYGPEARLGSSKAEVIVSDEPIAYPQVVVPDVLVCLSEEAARVYVDDVGDDTIVILDSTNIEKTQARRGRIHRLPITEAATGVGSKMAANVVALGVANALAEIVSKDSLRQAITHRVPERFRAMNEKALDVATAIAAAALPVV